MTSSRIEQAIFTSAETDQARGYQVVATSRGVSPVDLEELTTWGPTANTLLSPAPESVSLHFHPLPSGNCCIARTTPLAGPSAGAGTRLYTQNLILPPEAFGAFGNHPLRVFHAALARGVFQWMDRFPRYLPTLELSPAEAISDAVFLERMRRIPGPAWMAAIVQAVLDRVTTAIVGGPPAVHVIAGLLSALPMDCRSDLSFSTGLKFSTRRPFRVIGLSGNEEEQSRVQRLYNVSVLDLTRSAPDVNDLYEAWPQLVYRVLRSGHVDFLARRTGRPTPEATWDDLSALGLEWLEEMDRTVLVRGGLAETVPPETSARPSPGWDEALHSPFDLAPGSAEETPLPRVDVEPWSEQFRREFLGEPTPSPWEPNDDLPDNDLPDDASHGEDDPASPMRHAHTAHAGPWLGRLSYWNAGVELRELTPSRRLRESHPALRPDLESLDRHIYETLAGRPMAEQRLHAFWTAFRDETDVDVRREVAEAYMQFTLELLDGLFDPASSRQPDVAMRSLDIFALLSGDVV